MDFFKMCLVNEKWSQPVLYQVNECTKYQVLDSDLARTLQFMGSRSSIFLIAFITWTIKYVFNKTHNLFCTATIRKAKSRHIFNWYKNDKLIFNSVPLSNNYSKWKIFIAPIKIAANNVRWLEQWNFNKYLCPNQKSTTRKQEMF